MRLIFSVGSALAVSHREWLSLKEPDQRDSGILRWNPRSSEYTIDDKAFAKFGGIYLRQDGFIDPAFESWYSEGTAYMRTMEDILEGIVFLVGRDGLGTLFRRNWRGDRDRRKHNPSDVVDAFKGKFPGRKISHRHDDESHHTSGNLMAAALQNHLGETWGLIRTEKTYDLVELVVRNITNTMIDIIDFLRLIEDQETPARTGSRNTNIGTPHLGYLAMNDLESRLEFLEGYLLFLDNLKSWPIDRSLTNTAILNQAGLRLEARIKAVQKLYFTFASRYGLTAAARSSDKHGLVPSKNQRIQAQKFFSDMHKLHLFVGRYALPKPTEQLPIINSLHKSQAFREKGISYKHSKLQKATVYMKVDHVKVHWVKIFEESSYKSTLTTVIKDHFGSFLYALARPNIQVGLSDIEGGLITLYYTTEIFCYWQPELQKSRIIEILVAESVNSLISRPMALAVVFDSEELKPSDQIRKRILVDRYLNDYLRAAGVDTRIKGQFTDVHSKGGVCTDMPDLLTLYSRNINLKGYPPNICIEYPPWFNTRTSYLKFYPICLNYFPVGTKVYAQGTMGISKKTAKPFKIPDTLKSETTTDEITGLIKKSRPEIFMQIDKKYDIEAASIITHGSTGVPSVKKNASPPDTEGGEDTEISEPNLKENDALKTPERFRFNRVPAPSRHRGKINRITPTEAPINQAIDNPPYEGEVLKTGPIEPPLNDLDDIETDIEIVPIPGTSTIVAQCYIPPMFGSIQPAIESDFSDCLRAV